MPTFLPFAVLLPLLSLAPAGDPPAPMAAAAWPVAEQEAAEESWSGVLEEAGITTYQYGTHKLVRKVDGKETLLALKSDTLKLDDFVGKRVVIKGRRIAGYPIEGGPDYILVTRVTVVMVVEKG